VPFPFHCAPNPVFAAGGSTSPLRTRRRSRGSMSSARDRSAGFTFSSWRTPLSQPENFGSEHQRHRPAHRCGSRITATMQAYASAFARSQNVAVLLAVLASGRNSAGHGSPSAASAGGGWGTARAVGAATVVMGWPLDAYDNVLYHTRWPQSERNRTTPEHQPNLCPAVSRSKSRHRLALADHERRSGPV
jgi:hypothetical protein